MSDDIIPISHCPECGGQVKASCITKELRNDLRHYRISHDSMPFTVNEGQTIRMQVNVFCTKCDFTHEFNVEQFKNMWDLQREKLERERRR